MREGQVAAQSSRRANTATALSSLLTPIDAFDAHQITCIIETDVWICVQPTLTNGLSLSKDEWRDGMRRRYGLGFLDLPKSCDSCGAKFMIEHALACKKGVLVVG